LTVNRKAEWLRAAARGQGSEEVAFCMTEELVIASCIIADGPEGRQVLTTTGG
jgi:hypothetical protein